eukprot:gb/GFBE01017620.1/.p1 GENE.gb/GFBE01017620.1/~~gb/GFBE01017620.1/.p1  ORF type:complete len:254 (+),score=35.96 gb/GFBE01017620.1/:1-762(+)
MAVRFAGARAAGTAAGRRRAGRARSQMGLRPVPDSDRVRPQSAPAGKSQAQLRANFDDPLRFLWRFGYERGPPAPELSLTVEGHDEVLGHTMYRIRCSLRRPAKEEGTEVRVSEWACRKRLCDLREELHCRVKDGMGSEYATYFQSTPFARHGGIPGTTDRLRSWLATLAACVNSSQLKGQLLAFLLRFLEAPVPEDSEAELLVRAGRCVVCTLPTEMPDTELCRRCQALRADAVEALRTRSQKSRELNGYPA